MEARELVARLPEDSLEVISSSYPQAPLFTICFLTEDVCPFRPDVLYFARAAALPPSMPEGALLSCVVMDDGEVPEGLLAAGNANLARVAPGHDPLDLYNRLQGCLVEDADVVQAASRMLQALVSDRGMQHLVDEARAALGNPVAVVDPSCRYLASSGFDFDPEDDSPLARVMREEMRFETILEEGMGYIATAGIDDELARTPVPVVRTNELLGAQTMTQRVMVHGVCLARVIMVARHRPFLPADARKFEHLVSLVGQELQKGEVFTVSSAQMGSYFLGRLLDDEQPSRAATERRLRLLDFRPLPRLFVIVLRPKAGTLGAREVEGLKRHLQPMLQHCLVTVHEGHLVVLASRDVDSSLTPFDRRTLRSVAETNDLYVGVSNAFDDICETRRHLAQARAAIRYGSTYTKVLDDTGVYHYCEYSYMEMLGLCEDHRNLLNYCHPAIRTLWEHDRAHDSELVETLFAYMQNGCNTARTALLLSLHKNTLLYRLGRIKEIMGNDLSSGEDLFLFHLSIRVLIYLGLLEPRTRPRTSDDLRAHAR